MSQNASSLQPMREIERLVPKSRSQAGSWQRRGRKKLTALARDAAAADPDPAAREAGQGEALPHLRILDWAWAGGVRGHHAVPVRLHRSCLVRLRVAAAAAT